MRPSTDGDCEEAFQFGGHEGIFEPGKKSDSFNAKSQRYAAFDRAPHLGRKGDQGFHGPKARERFDNEVRVLRHLKAHGCGLCRGCSKRMKTNCAWSPPIAAAASSIWMNNGPRNCSPTGEIRRPPRRCRHAQRDLPAVRRALLLDRFRVRYHSSRNQTVRLLVLIMERTSGEKEETK